MTWRSIGAAAEPVAITLDGGTVHLPAATTLAAGLVAAGLDDRPRCLIGTCQQCRVIVGGREVRGCRVALSPGLTVRFIAAPAPGDSPASASNSR